MFFLHPLALTVLRGGHQAAGSPSAGPVFTAPRSGKALTTWHKAKAELDQAAELVGWRLHDTRRSFVTALAEAGVPAEVVADAILNHRQSATRGGVLGVYQQATRLPEQRAAMDRWGQLLRRAAPAGVPAAAQRRPKGPRRHATSAYVSF